MDNAKDLISMNMPELKVLLAGLAIRCEQLPPTGTKKKADLVGWCLYYQQFERTYRIMAAISADGEDNGGEDNGGAGNSSARISSAGISSAGISSAGKGGSTPSRSTLTVVGSAARTPTSYDADSLREARARYQKESVNSKSANNRRNYLREIKKLAVHFSNVRVEGRPLAVLMGNNYALDCQLINNIPLLTDYMTSMRKGPNQFSPLEREQYNNAKSGPKPQFLPSVGAYYTVISCLRCARGRRGDDATVAVLVLVWCCLLRSFYRDSCRAGVFLVLLIVRFFVVLSCCFFVLLIVLPIVLPIVLVVALVYPSSAHVQACCFRATPVCFHRHFRPRDGHVDAFEEK